VADDWKCEDDRPITDIHWWGSFIGWNQPHLPPVVPKAFHIGIWTDIPDPDPCDPNDFSHPAHLIWENYCDNWVWNFAGYDRDPRGPNEPNEPNELEDACFQFTQLLSQDEWFYQEPNDPNGRVYWLSIAAIYDPNDYNNPNFYPWGWKTREHFFNDDAVRIWDANIWPPHVCTWYNGGDPIRWPDPNTSWDMAFELTTNRPDTNLPPGSPDLNHDGMVDFKDFAIFAAHWLKSVP
jgi:hypothetical protein